jgi:uncharacterized membrane protein
MFTWYAEPIANSYFPVFLAAAALLALALLRPTFRELEPRKRRILVGLRISLLVLLLFAMLRPGFMLVENKQLPAVLLIMIDRSKSMQLPDTDASKTRWQSQLQTLRAASKQFDAIAKKMEIKVYAYDSKLYDAEAGRTDLGLPAVPDGDETDIGANLSDVVQREGGQKRIVGVVLLGDGTQTAVAPRIDPHDAARELAQVGAPLFPIVFGPVGSGEQSRDIAVESLPDRYDVFAKNVLRVRGALRVRGFRGRPIPVELVQIDRAGVSKVIKHEMFNVDQDSQQIEIAMDFIPETAGEFQLKLRVPVQDGELVAKNNELVSFLRVLEGGIRILYISGTLLGEQRILRRSLDASPEIEIDFQWIDFHERASWPVKLGQVLGQTKYDAVIFESIHSSAFTEADLRDLATKIDGGTGFMMIGGLHSFGAGNYGGSPLASVLPIEIGRFERQQIDEPIRRDLQFEGPLVVAPKSPHSITRLAAAAENEKAWSKLPPLEGSNRFDAVKERGRVLLATPDNRPILVSMEYGTGRVLAFGGESTRRWWNYGFQNEHRRFWRQVILWLVRREDLSQNDVWLKLDQARLTPGGKLTFTTGARGAEGEALTDASFIATLKGPSGKSTTINVTSSGEEFRGASAVLREPGFYSLELVATREGNEIGRAVSQCMVIDQDVEMQSLGADIDQMTRLAAATKEVGGRMLAPEQLGDLLEELAAQPDDQKIEVRRKWGLGDSAPDAWIFVILMSAIYTVEWYLRKKWGLV